MQKPSSWQKKFPSGQPVERPDVDGAAAAADVGDEAGVEVPAQPPPSHSTNTRPTAAIPPPSLG